MSREQWGRTAELSVELWVKSGDLMTLWMTDALPWLNITVDTKLGPDTPNRIVCGLRVTRKPIWTAHPLPGESVMMAMLREPDPTHRPPDAYEPTIFEATVNGDSVLRSSLEKVLAVASPADRVAQLREAVPLAKLPDRTSTRREPEVQEQLVDVPPFIPDDLASLSFIWNRDGEEVGLRQSYGRLVPRVGEEIWFLKEEPRDWPAEVPYTFAWRVTRVAYWVPRQLRYGEKVPSGADFRALREAFAVHSVAIYVEPTGEPEIGPDIGRDELTGLLSRVRDRLKRWNDAIDDPSEQPWGDLVEEIDGLLGRDA